MYRAVDRRGRVIDVYVSQRRHIASARTYLRRDHYELAVDTAPLFRLATAFDELMLAV